MLWQPTRGILQPNQHWRRPQTVVAAAPFAIDGYINGQNTSAADIALTLSTTYAGDYIIVWAARDGSINPSGASGSTLGAFTQIADPPSEVIVFAAFASSTLSSEVITVSRGGGPGSTMTAEAFGVSGSNQSSLVWDGGGFPTSTGASISFTNSTAACMIIGLFGHGGNQNPFPQGSFSTVSGNTTGSNYMLSEKLIVSATGTNSVAGDGGAYSGVAFGIPKV